MNILLTSAGRRSYLVTYFKEALGNSGKVHAANSEWSTALEVADKAVLTPLIYDENYISFILEYCRNEDITLVLSLFDIDLPVLAKSKDIFRREGVNVIVSDYPVTQICNDKWATFQFLESNNIKSPKSYLDLEQVKNDLNSDLIKFPLIIKPRWGMGSISIFKAENTEELHVLYQKVKREIHNSYLKYESEVAPDQAVIIQEYINGQEYGLDIVNDLEKNYVTTLVKKKNGMRSGETDGAITIENTLLETTGKKISQTLGHIGNLDCDCFISDDKAYVLELNCRFGGGYPFSHIAGADLPKAIIKWGTGQSAKDLFKNYKYGIESRKDITIIKSIR
jgi:carbamoyl-phosphate synthase large subunit